MNEFLWGGRAPRRTVLFGLQQLPFSEFYNLLFKRGTGGLLTDAILAELVSADPEVIRARQELLSELYENKRIAECFRRFADEYIGWREYAGNRFDDNGDAIANIDPCGHVTAVLNTIGDFAHVLQNAKSAIARELKTQIETLRADLSLDRFGEKWKKIWFDILDARGYAVGLNFDEDLLPAGCKLLSVDQKPIPEPKKSLKRFFLRDGFYKIMVGRRQYWVLTAMKENKDFMDFVAAFPGGFRVVLNDTSADLHADVKNFIRRVLAVLAPYAAGAVFCLAGLNLIEQWEKAGIGWCFATEKAGAFETRGLFDLFLLEKIGKAAVPNDLTLNGEIGIVTGANAGGKTRYLVSVLTAQLLYQLGFPVPAKSALIGAADSISAVFADEESGKIGTGRLGEELLRLAGAIGPVKSGNGFFAFNEALTGTSGRDAAEIMGETLCSLMNAGARGLVVTHLLKLAAHSADFNENIEGSRLIPLTAQVGEDLQPTYKIIPAPSAQTSYAKNRFTTVG